MSFDIKTDSRPIMTYANPHHHADTHRANPSYDSINWTYPTQYRPRGPDQSVPSAAHTPSTSISSTTTCHPGKGVNAQDVIARILETDSIPQGTYLASQKAKKCSDGQEKKYPERNDSRRALLSMANGIKAPLLLRGPSHSNHSATGRKVRARAPVTPLAVPKRTSEVHYLHKELPPTPPSTNSSKSAHSPLSASSSQYAVVVPERKATMPMTKPLDLSINSNTLAAKRLSRAKGKSNSGFVLSRFRAVPAPIRPPQFRGPGACNGPSSASTTEEFTEDAKIEDLQLGEPLIQQPHQGPQKPKVIMTPMGELPITPLDIPVDWDDLHDRWTSPIAVHPTPEQTSSGQAFVFDAFRQDIDELFARSPTIAVRGSVEAGWSAERQELSGGQSRDAHPFSCAADLNSEGSDGEKKGKRHGKVLVKEELKLCLELNAEFSKRRRSSNKHGAGESFLMMTSPLSPDTASLGASIMYSHDIYDP
jgi:hypothetical protein